MEKQKEEAFKLARAVQAQPAAPSMWTFSLSTSQVSAFILGRALDFRLSSAS